MEMERQQWQLWIVPPRNWNGINILEGDAAHDSELYHQGIETLLLLLDFLWISDSELYHQGIETVFYVPWLPKSYHSELYHQGIETQ